LVAAWAPVLVGTSIALAFDSLVIVRALAALFVAVAIQVGTNLVNDAADHARGADTAGRLGPPRAVALGLLDGDVVMKAGLVCFALAGIAGLWLAAMAGWWLLVPGAIALLAGYAYTAGPKPLAYLGLGEVFVFVFFGLIATVGTTFVQTVGINAGRVAILFATAAGAALGFLATVILEVNNLRDAPTDVLVGKATLAVRLGDARTRGMIRWLCVGAYVALLLPVAFLFYPWVPFWLLAYLTIPVAVGIVRTIREGATGRALNPVLGRVAKLEAMFAMLVSLGYVIVWALGRWI